MGRIAHEAPVSASPPESGGMLFNAEEAASFFKLGDPVVKVADQSLTVTSEMLEEVKTTSRSILESMNHQADANLRLNMNLITALTEIQNLASSQRLTQTSVDALIKSFEELPSERRTYIMGLLGNFGAGVWLAVLQRVLGS